MKKLKIYVLALFFFSFLKINAGCCGQIKVSNSSGVLIHTLYYNSTILTLELDPLDSFMVRGYSCGCLDAVEKVWYNDSLISDPLFWPDYVILMAKPGKYKIRINLFSSGGSLDGTIIIANKQLQVGINEYINTNQWLSLFPNPSKESVTVNSFEENFKNVAIYNVNSELIEIIETESNSLTIPISQYPQGIYIVKVATLSDKIAIKKLIVSN